MSSRQTRKDKKARRREKMRGDTTTTHLNQDKPWPMGQTKDSVISCEVTHFKLSASCEFIDYLHVIAEALPEEGDRLPNFICQHIANVLNRVDGFGTAFATFMEELEPIVCNLFHDAPMDKIRDVFREGLKLTQEHFLDNEWYDVDGFAERWVSGYTKPQTLLLRQYGSKEKSHT